MNLSIVEMAVKSSLVIAAAAVAAGLMHRRASAASRHLVWTLAVLGLLMLPIASMAMPTWAIARTPMAAGDPQPVTGGNVDRSPDGLSEEGVQRVPATTSTPWSALFPAAYATGVLLLLIRLGGEQCRVRLVVSRATEVTSPDWTSLLRECTARIGVHRPVRLVWSREHAMPMACGLLRPVVLIPSVAEMWDEDRRRAVLLHELAHVVRFDCLSQMLAELAVGLYWPNPGVWWTARRLQFERELACDDSVLAAGTEPRAYAGHLLELAYSLGGSRAPALAVAMARPRQLEGRMRAMLDPTRNRATPAAKRRLLALASAVLVVAPLAAATTVAVSVAPVESVSFTPASVQDGVAAAQPMTPGTWEIRPSGAAGRLELTLNDGHHSFHGTTVPVERLEGISPALLSGAGGPAMFSLRRDAGTLTFEGVFRSGVGGGTYTFTPSTTFPQELARRGFAHPTPAEQWALALADVGFAFLDELTAQKYARPNLAQLVSAAQHGASADYVRQMGQLGYRLGTIDALIRQRDHGVSPLFIRQLRDEGLDGLTADDLVRARDHGVSPEYVGALRALGYTHLTLDGLVGARDHGISPDYVRDLRQLGYQLSLAELTSARDHGVSAEYLKALAGLGYERIPLGDLVHLRDHGVSPDWLRKVKAGSSTHLSIDELVSMRDHGLDSPARGPQLYSWSWRARLKAVYDSWLR